MQPKHLPEQNPSPRIIAKNSDRKFPSRQARVGCSPRGGVDPNAAWIPRSSPRAHAPPRPAKSNTRRGGGEPRRRLRGKECLLCRDPVWCGVGVPGVCGVPRWKQPGGGLQVRQRPVGWRAGALDCLCG
jgi:hypothetical protein